MIEYPKIETLYDRDEHFKVDVTRLRLPEFDLIRWWYVTEKIDGTNIRVGYCGGPGCSFAGRTDHAQIPQDLRAYLEATFTPDKMEAVFGNGETETVDVILFGEGYGPKINNGGAYRQNVSFRLFDVWINGWWLEPKDAQDIAAQLYIGTVPVLETALDFFPVDANDLDYILKGASMAAKQDGGAGRRAEGLVARTVPGLFTRNGKRLMWKLKYKDFK